MDYRWNLTDLLNIPRDKGKVFSCFSCGGGSSMGYKLVGFNVIGNVEIDPKMMKLYQENHHPRYPYLMDIREFNQIPDDKLPAELFDLDILDGSPPCSTFSIAGKREKKWGKEAQFREGQKKQRLDMLFFDYINTTARLQPKVVIAENVKGITMGKARGFMKEIIQAFQEAGYVVQVFCLNAATMGIPQGRERVFFICHRKDLDYPRLELSFDEKPIPFGEIKGGPGPELKKDGNKYRFWCNRQFGDLNLGDVTHRMLGIERYFNTGFLYDDRVVSTIASNAGGRPVRYESPHHISNEEIILAQSFPMDYDFINQDVQYVCGMSVPPVMMGRIAAEVYRQWLSQ